MEQKYGVLCLITCVFLQDTLAHSHTNRKLCAPRRRNRIIVKQHSRLPPSQRKHTRHECQDHAKDHVSCPTIPSPEHENTHHTCQNFENTTRRVASSIVVTRQSELLEAHPDRVSSVVPHLSKNLFLSQTPLRVSTSFRPARIVTYVPALVGVWVFFRCTVRLYCFAFNTIPSCRHLQYL